MKIIISPAKKMRVQTDIMEETGMPVFWRMRNGFMIF